MSDGHNDVKVPRAPPRGGSPALSKFAIIIKQNCSYNGDIEVGGFPSQDEL